MRAIRDLEQGRVRLPQRRTVTMLADVFGLTDDLRAGFLAAARTGRAPVEGSQRHRDQRCGTQPNRSGPGARSRFPAQLPGAVSDLTGRDRELSLIRAHAGAAVAGDLPASVVVSVHGPPGIGKTSLVVSAGTGARELFPGGQLFIDLRGTDPDPLDSSEVVERFLRALGVPDARIPASLPERSALLRTLTSRVRLLMVLDNAADEAQVRPLLPAGSHCLVLVTSRRPLIGLECVDRIGLDVLPASAGHRLLGTIVGRRIAAEPVEARELVDLCGALPLALRIAGNRLATRPHWPVRHLVERLRDEHQRLTALTAGDLGVRATIDVSYRQLDRAAAQVFRHATLIPGQDFGVDLAAIVAGHDPATTSAALETLVDAGLLGAIGIRYRFHDLVRLYARERLNQEPSPVRRDAEDRILSWLLARTTECGRSLDTEAADPTITPEQRAQARAWLDNEADNWLAALRDGLRLGRHAEVVAATRALHWYSDAATHRHPWVEVFGLGVAAAQAADQPSDEVVLRNFTGWALYFCAERYDDARAVFRQARAQAEQLGDDREQAWAMAYLAAIALRTSEPDEAVALSRRAAAIFSELGFAIGTESALGVLGAGLSALGRCAEALEIHRAALRSYQQRRATGAASTEVGEAMTTMSIAQDLAGLGRLADAEATMSAAQVLFRNCDMPYGEGVAAYRRGLLLRDIGDGDAAVACLQHGADVFAEIGAVSWELRAREALTMPEDTGSGTSAARPLV